MPFVEGSEEHRRFSWKGKRGGEAFRRGSGGRADRLAPRRFSAIRRSQSARRVGFARAEIALFEANFSLFFLLGRGFSASKRPWSSRSRGWSIPPENARRSPGWIRIGFPQHGGPDELRKRQEGLDEREAGQLRGREDLRSSPTLSTTGPAFSKGSVATTRRAARRSSGSTTTFDRLFWSAKIYRMVIPYTIDPAPRGDTRGRPRDEFKACYIRPLVYRGYGTSA